MEKVALVEFGGSHDECLLSQFMAMKRHKCHITFVGTAEIWKRNPSWYPFVDQFHEIAVYGDALGDFMKMKRLNTYFEKEKISKVVLNTAQGGHIRNLCLTASSNIEFIGIIHTLRKFEGSFTQRLISWKIKKYLLLNDYFLPKISQNNGLNVASFYPLRFPHYEFKIEKNPKEVWITIIGGVENRRKDLVGSLLLMKALGDQAVRFIFLGKSIKDSDEVLNFKKEISQAGLLDKIQLFDSFVPAEQFDAYLKNTDVIWPMVHPDTPSADQYFRNQISGAMNVAFAYKIPLLVHSAYTSEWKDLWCAINYTEKTFAADFRNGVDKLQQIRQKMIESEKFNADFQEAKYLKFIFE